MKPQPSCGLGNVPRAIGQNLLKVLPLDFLQGHWSRRWSHVGTGLETIEGGQDILDIGRLLRTGRARTFFPRSAPVAAPLEFDAEVAKVLRRVDRARFVLQQHRDGIAEQRHVGYSPVAFLFVCEKNAFAPTPLGEGR